MPGSSADANTLRQSSAAGVANAASHRSERERPTVERPRAKPSHAVRSATADVPPAVTSTSGSGRGAKRRPPNAMKIPRGTATASASASASRRRCRSRVGDKSRLAAARMRARSAAGGSILQTDTVAPPQSFANSMTAASFIHAIRRAVAPRWKKAHATGTRVETSRRKGAVLTSVGTSNFKTE